MEEKLIDAFLNLFPFASWLEKLGLNKEQSTGLSMLIVVVCLWLIWSLLKSLTNFKQERKKLKAAKDLKPYFDYEAVEKATRYYVPTQGQQVSPAREEEPGLTHKVVLDRKPLISYFIKKAFSEKSESERFYLVLADSGMGKTTFMVNLYLQYHGFFNRHRQHTMRLFRFSHPDTLAEIKAIRDQGIEAVKNTILLLDALDEDPNIVSKDPNVTDAEAFRHRLDEIIEATRNFCEVVITCRTQYFPGQEQDPYELKVRRADERGFHTLNKIYLSPFTDEEVRLYLRKKFGFLPFRNAKKKKRAAEIVRQSRHLVMRPMMLSYIDYLLEDEREYHSLYDIYETLIEKWLKREAEKRKQRYEEQSFIEKLRNVSQQTAFAIYQHWRNDQRQYLTKEEAVGIAQQHQIDLRPEEVTGQSLLTCDGVGNWKFAHKSIMEFFLAKGVLDDPTQPPVFNVAGMDMARQFFLERNTMPLLVPLKGGDFWMGSPDTETGRGEDETLHPVQVSDFWMGCCLITLGQFETFVQAANYKADADKEGGSNLWDGKKWILKPGINWRCDAKGALQKDKKHPVLHVSWNDATAYCAWLSQVTGRPHRLPTEAEWEYACRAGSNTPFYTGKNLTTLQANYDGNYPYNKNAKGTYVAKTTSVSSYAPNAWGLYDMHGNAWEWCHDWYGKTYYDECKAAGTVQNPTGATTGAYRVLRGGSWSNYAVDCRAAYRSNHAPQERHDNIGFRVATSSQ